MVRWHALYTRLYNPPGMRRFIWRKTYRPRRHDCAACHSSGRHVHQARLWFVCSPVNASVCCCCRQRLTVAPHRAGPHSVCWPHHGCRGRMAGSDRPCRLELAPTLISSHTCFSWSQGQISHTCFSWSQGQVSHRCSSYQKADRAPISVSASTQISFMPSCCLCIRFQRLAEYMYPLKHCAVARLVLFQMLTCNCGPGD